MRAYRLLRAIALAIREWWRRRHDVPAMQICTVDDVVARFDPERVARDMARLGRMQGMRENHRPVKPMGRLSGAG